ncbi:MAG: phosphodiester glycosidase family protein [Anaerolineae bacterium]|nr:phosphodiester glycosidase family protein [Anaerolineae bacterium]
MSGTAVPVVTPAAIEVTTLLPTRAPEPTLTGPGPTRTPLPTVTATPSPTPVVPDTGWERLPSSLERRIVNLLDEQGEMIEQLYMLRFDPQYFVFGVAYHANPQSLEAWQAETGALVLVNGGYYRREGEIAIPNGLTVIDGTAMGQSFGSFAGMLAITDDGPELRWLAQHPYDPDEPLRAALQSFPLLVKPGGEIGFPEQHEDHIQARRTVIGQDRYGRILFIIASWGYFTLHQISRYLVTLDLDLEIAINLDGGPSTGILVADPLDQIPAFTLLPIVITVHPR